MVRKGLLRQGLKAAEAAREAAEVDPFGPADPYAAAESFGLRVNFLATSMEGFYFKGEPANILVSSLRPVGRRAFTCAHELGHHWFGHGSTIDQLQEDERDDSSKPDEVLANAFAAFFLMPTVVVRAAFAARGWVVSAPTPVQLFTIACELGVGYATLLNHLSYTLREINASARAELKKWTPQRIRNQLLADKTDEPITILDGRSAAPTYDVEKDASVLLPAGAQVVGKALVFVRSLDEFDLYRAARRGQAAVIGAAEPGRVRVMPKKYEGPAHRRFLEDPDED
jgi:Zn-dependent peptidase ImmA (M78 family)